MNCRFFFILLLGLVWAEYSYGAGISAATNGVYLVVTAARDGAMVTNEPIHIDDRLLWMTFCDTGKVELSHPVDGAYGVRIRMRDGQGNDVPKTSLGKSFGSKFDRLKSILDTGVYPVIAWGAYSNNLGCGGGKFLPQPGKLFEIDKPGIYNLEIQMQMFLYVPSRDPVERSKTLFRFSPIQIKVEKLPHNRSAIRKSVIGRVGPTIEN